MRLLIPVLVKDENWKEHKDKLKEEVDEVIEAIENLEKLGDQLIVFEEVVEEAMDVIQVAIGIIDKVWKLAPAVVTKSISNHITKLINRGWKFSKVLRVEED